MPGGFTPPGGLKGKTSAVNTTTSSNAGKQRINNNAGLKGVLPGATAKKSSVTKTIFDTNKGPSKTVSPYGTKQWQRALATNIIWNLPPHQWSLPTLPSNVDSVNGKRNWEQAVSTNSGMSGSAGTASLSTRLPVHGARRGRIWFFDVAGEAENLNSNGELQKNSTLTGSNAGLKGTVGARGDIIAGVERNYGFQFLWNPETIQSSVVRNMNITPSAADKARVVSGAFPGQEQFTVSIVLDRINDFACAKGLGVSVDSTGRISKAVALTKIQAYYAAGGEYYGANQSIPRTQKINDLLTQGTMADLEYLFKAINGSLTNQDTGASIEWANLLGKKTANIGYLQPSLMAFQFGPTLANLAWVGWINNIQITHTFFSQNMIPLRTEVSMSVDAFTGTGVSSGL